MGDAALTADQILAAIAAAYRDEPDDKALSVGDWTQPVGELPRFCARVRITLGEVRTAIRGAGPRV